ncbi:right-handed parallel beta-helix repeat-containing protein [Candidatus Bipolaricaulota bacterium]|nr:right-handed parallel beta-helix repeat-containing protein [Candidatus Bipolaricaulota bacterium]
MALVLGWLCLAAEKPNIVVEDNLIAENGLGIYLGWQGDWYIAVVGNRIERNGEGVRIVNRKAIIERNTIADNVIGVRITAEHEEGLVTEVEWVTLRDNSFVGNELYALQNLAPITVDARRNWWGPGGPRTAAEEWTLLPWIFSVSGVTPSLTLCVGPVDTEGGGVVLSLGGLGFCRALGPVSGRGGITLDVRDLEGWRTVFIPWTVSLSGNLIMGPVECDDWLTRPTDSGEGGGGG